MNLQALGYVIKRDPAVVCSQCHRQRNFKNYVSQHSGHVDQRRFDCSWCHAFTRPELGLTPDPTP